MFFETETLKDLEEIATLKGSNVTQVIHEISKLYVAKEKPRLAKLAKLKAKLLPA